MEGDKDAAVVKTPMIYICGECHGCVQDFNLAFVNKANFGHVGLNSDGDKYQILTLLLSWYML